MRAETGKEMRRKRRVNGQSRKKCVREITFERVGLPVEGTCGPPQGTASGPYQSLPSTTITSLYFIICQQDRMNLEKVSPPDHSQAHFNVAPESIACVYTEVLIYELLVFKNI